MHLLRSRPHNSAALPIQTVIGALYFQIAAELIEIVRDDEFAVLWFVAEDAFKHSSEHPGDSADIADPDHAAL